MTRLTMLLMAMGLAIGVVCTSALWMVVTGLRVDATGTFPGTAELLLGWGGLAAGCALAATAAVGLATSQAGSAHRMR